jgi:prolyl-tRNA synthetase
LNEVWDTVAPEIRKIIKSYGIMKSYTIDTARFFTHAPPGGDEKKGSLGPVVVWICIQPGAISADIAHDASQQILTLLQKHEVEGVVVEWRESVVQRVNEVLINSRKGGETSRPRMTFVIKGGLGDARHDLLSETWLT